MILLIYESKTGEVVEQEFKFHYDSINFVVVRLCCNVGSKFKFHYDSINFDLSNINLM